ncbi:hypothetical protein [Zhongshania aliphaticivorans]|uniref:hypothetical protein n=1 Tax=Zhongshania aliphaticivorans TaxID=1470434 RepID=UPI0013303828|nr:hypothetical protein [Zhongshania aliphaticivorans]
MLADKQLASWKYKPLLAFNFVAASNKGAVRLWNKLGFETVGRLPNAFYHPTKNYVDALVMYEWLQAWCCDFN